MGLHPSLKIDAAGVQQRTVLTRIERIKDLMKKGLWEDRKSVTALPKVKVVRVKSRKTKSKEEAAGAAPAAGAATPAAAAKAAPAAKAGAPKK